MIGVRATAGLALAAALPCQTPIPASVSSTGTCLRSYVFSPDGIGGYDTTMTGGLLDPQLGTSLGFTRDNALSAPLDLGFEFPFPGGQRTRLVRVDANGRILVDGTAATSDPSPTVAELTGAGWPTIACWSDFNPRGGGDVTFETTAGVFASFTWRDVPQFGSTMGQTFQFQLFVDGTVILTVADMSGFNFETFRKDDLLVGLSAGSVAPPTGELDLSAAPLSSFGIPHVFELFAATESFDLQTNPKLATLTFPHVGSAWHMRVVNTPPTATTALFLVGFARTEFDLGGIGAEPGCALLTEVQFSTPRALSAGSASIVLSIPASSMFGLEAFVQVVTDGGATPLPITLSNRLEGTLGS